MHPIQHPGPMPAPVSWSAPSTPNLISRAQGWVGEATREVETWSTPAGTMLKISGVGNFYVAPNAILREDENADRPWTSLEREIAMGPALVLALAQHETWCMHASAVLFQGQATAFVGESGQGKSSLAGYLSQAGWPLVADDMLPVTRGQVGAQAWPHFPQLKLKIQPGAGLAEQLPLSRVFVLDQAAIPKISRLSAVEALQALIRHTAGTRLLSPFLLSAHLAFCAWAVGILPVYRLAYPRDWETLPVVKKLLEKSC